MLAALFIVTVAIWISYEVWLLYKHKPTVTDQVYRMVVNYPPAGALIGLLVGGLFSHLFWSATCAYK